MSTHAARGPGRRERIRSVKGRRPTVTSGSVMEDRSESKGLRSCRMERVLGRKRAGDKWLSA